LIRELLNEPERRPRSGSQAYTALRGLTPSAGIVQLAVPVLAALGGVVLLGGTITARLALAAALVLGGIAWAIVGRGRPLRG